MWGLCQWVIWMKNESKVELESDKGHENKKYKYVCMRKLHEIYKYWPGKKKMYWGCNPAVLTEARYYLFILYVINIYSYILIGFIINKNWTIEILYHVCFNGLHWVCFLVSFALIHNTFWRPSNTRKLHCNIQSTLLRKKVLFILFG